MGVVYEAEDTRLSRTVALTFLPEECRVDSERLRRFLQEARAASALDHPNIVTVHDVAEVEGRTFIVMQFVPGKTLRDLIGRLHVPEALAIALQIAEGVSAAHRAGIVHRDLKPENILVSDGGVVKILDFGIAKLSEPASVDTEAPTRVNENLTEEGVILGTPSYMSPEQVSGKKLDARTDVFSFGSILFEMLTGKRAFGGATFGETSASILERDPDWAALPQKTPFLLRRLLEQCLRKSAEERIRDLGDAALELKEMLATPAASVASSRKPRGSRLASSIAGVLALGLLGLMISRSPRPSEVPSEARQPRFFLPVPPGVSIPGFPTGPSYLAISPTGEHVVFTGDYEGSRALYVRDLRELDARRLPGTEGATCPFFSPDGRWVGFAAGEKLKKIALDGGAVVPLADAPQMRGGSWGEDGGFSSRAEVEVFSRYPRTEARSVKSRRRIQPASTITVGPTSFPAAEPRSSSRLLRL